MKEACTTRMIFFVSSCLCPSYTLYVALHTRNKTLNMNPWLFSQGSTPFNNKLVTGCKSPTLALQEDEDNDKIYQKKHG